METEGKKLTIGIDPGSLGGIAVLDQDGNVIAITKMPQTMLDIYEYLKEITDLPCEKLTCYIEKVGFGIPGQSSKATATFARHCGRLEMALLALSIPTVEVPPQKWMKTLGLGSSKGIAKTEWKNKLKEHAQQRFPSLWKEKKITLATCDALLIANYGRTQL